jgi:hypothetical protein
MDVVPAGQRALECVQELGFGTVVRVACVWIEQGPPPEPGDRDPMRCGSAEMNAQALSGPHAHGVDVAGQPSHVDGAVRWRRLGNGGSGLQPPSPAGGVVTRRCRQGSSR